MAADSILEPEDEPIELENEDEPISLVASDGDSAPGGLELKTIGAAADIKKTEFTRPLNVDGSGATRVRIFHSKISLAPLDNLEQTINEWIDGNKVEVKHIGQLIGTMEGKRPEPNLLVMVWY